MDEITMKDYIMLSLLPFLKETIREIDYYGIYNLMDDVDAKLVDALKRYQNEDFGFQSKLEPDTRLPLSTNLGTSTAVKFFKIIFSRKEKIELAKGIVQYFENSYDRVDERFYITIPEVDHYPHAFWWNYENMKEWFEYGNPEGIIIGFLNKYSTYVKNLDLDYLNDKYIAFILSDLFDDVDKHALINAITFYDFVDISIRKKIKDKLQTVTLKLLEQDKDSWDDYALEPYKVLIASEHLLDKDNPLLKKNISYIKKKIREKSVAVPWDWNQYPEEFEEVKKEWVGHIYLDMIFAVYLYEGLD